MEQRSSSRSHASSRRGKVWRQATVNLSARWICVGVQDQWRDPAWSRWCEATEVKHEAQAAGELSVVLKLTFEWGALQISTSPCDPNNVNAFMLKSLFLHSFEIQMYGSYGSGQAGVLHFFMFRYSLTNAAQCVHLEIKRKGSVKMKEQRRRWRWLYSRVLLDFEIRCITSQSPSKGLIWGHLSELQAHDVI